jgi:RimJ/RimL family protein N-acetyltransferase
LKSENNKFIGGIALELLQSNPQITETFGDNVADLGWILDKNYWNHGFVTEAAFAVVKLAKSLGYKKLIAQCDKDNIGSYRVMEKIGMTLFSDNGVRFNKCEPNVPKTELMYTMDL